jgi:hypothetical protein
MVFRYNRYLMALDVFGLISATAVAAYMLLPDEWRLRSNQDGMVANVLSEFVGIWVSVRLIDFFIRSNERRDRARVRSVRNLRLIERMVVNVLLFKNGYEVTNLRRELTWTDSMRQQRNRFLATDEIADVDAFYALAYEFCSLIPEFDTLLHRDAVTFTNEDAAKEIEVRIEAARLKAEKNILEETEEDTGL